MPETTTEPTALAVPDTEAVREALAELDDYTRCVCTFEPPAGGGHYASCNADLRPAVEVLRAALAAAPAEDDAHTETVTEYRVVFGPDGESTICGRDEDEAALAAAFRMDGWTNVRVESRTVTTSRRESEWKATDQ